MTTAIELITRKAFGTCLASAFSEQIRAAMVADADRISKRLHTRPSLPKVPGEGHRAADMLIVATLAGMPEPIHAAEIARLSGLNRVAVARALRRMAHSGEVQEVCYNPIDRHRRKRWRVGDGHLAPDPIRERRLRVVASMQERPDLSIVQRASALGLSHRVMQNDLDAIREGRMSRLPMGRPTRAKGGTEN